MFLTKIEKLTSLYKLIIANSESEEDKIYYSLEYLIHTIPDFEQMRTDEKEELVIIVLDNFIGYVEEA